MTPKWVFAAYRLWAEWERRESLRRYSYDMSKLRQASARAKR